MAPPHLSLQEAAAWLLTTDASELVVLDDQQRICGVISDCEVAIGAIGGGRHPRDITLGDLLAAKPR